MASPIQFTIGTRGSPLAVTQTRRVLDLLTVRFPKVRFVVKEIRTEGDIKADAPLESLPRGLFAKELEMALERKEIDLAVHSYKDLPTDIAAGFTIAAISQREDPRDVLISSKYPSLKALPKGARIGTGSPRRSAQLNAWRPDLVMVAIRGNIGTRIAKASGPDMDGVVLAAAGVHRLKLQSSITEYIDVELCIPEPGQGALALEIRSGDEQARGIAAVVDDAAARRAVTSEVAVLRTLGGGCKSPIAAFAELKGDKLFLRAMVSDPSGQKILRSQAEGPADFPDQLGRRVARALLGMGAAEILGTEEQRHGAGHEGTLPRW